MSDSETKTKKKNNKVELLSFGSDDVTEVSAQPRRPKRRKKKKSKLEAKFDKQEQHKKRKRAEEVRARKKYRRGAASQFKGVRDKKLVTQLKSYEMHTERAVKAAAASEILLPSEQGTLQTENEMERTWRVSQEEIKSSVDVRAASRAFDLKLDKFGPYNADFTRSGRHLLLGGRKGHLAILDWSKHDLQMELQVAETVRDVKWLHDETMFAVAQKKFVYIYDNVGTELHVLRHHIEPNRLEFLPYHFLLVSVGKNGRLSYHDTSTGQVVVQHRTSMGDCDVMCQNPYNAVILLGHTNGQVTMWTPNMSTPVVKMFTHRAKLTSIAVDRSGRYLTTAGMDAKVRVWDVRTYKELFAYNSRRPVTSTSISQTGMLALGAGPHVHVWKDALRVKQKDPYMVHRLPGSLVRSARFCPFEDVLGLGHAKGFSTMLVPGAGQANFDTLEANPFQSTKQRREATVHRLLDKIQADMISLNPDDVGKVDRTPANVLRAEHMDRKIESRRKELENATDRSRMRGKNKSSKRWRRKKGNVIDLRTMERKREQQRRAAERKREQEQRERQETGNARSALSRFTNKQQSY
eukprot:TRINITY_DN66002_c4_g1_i1.p1 TRINITY_DN66002_c4_g1~~TRINITY_DN66002_c4_g1_i1.p1  ORF type:complete len:579 (+),score=299.94 TRINITY_DN66002_c4_g1_i1:67-1803(+)